MPPINIYQFIILVVLALVLLGPERLPQYAQALARWTKKARHWADDAKVRFRDETGADFDDVDWQKYDPRQYDPRRIIREALAEEMAEADLIDAPSRKPSPRLPQSNKSVDPLELFGGHSAGGTAVSETREGRERRGAVAAGVAGAAASTKTAEFAPEYEAQDPLAYHRAPFDSEAT